MCKKRTPEQNRRYKLHQKIKKRFEYCAKKKDGNSTS